ncbi:YdcF family protein [Paenibacillus sp. yr247]|uniref:YdcF family protein n=1 Tax=Paenibacillus sp. yr247 TaxID=1761880 RepID=UPI001586FA2C|nr:YdcF family protein [Paenibacillus sp. yr247]
MPRLTKRENALIVLGYQCKDNKIHRLLKERLDAALELDRRYQFPVIILSGGAQASERSEAEIMKDYMIQNGLDIRKIYVEDQSLDTIQNLVNCKEIMSRQSLRTCVIISNSFHLRRIGFIAQTLGMHANFYAYRTFSVLLWQILPTLNELKAFRITTRLLRENTITKLM